MLFNLPTENSRGSDYDEVNKLVIISHQGIGKTSACAQLPNSLILDLEDGYRDYFEGKSLNLKQIAASNNVPLGKVFIEAAAKIKAANAEKGGFAYDFVIIDNLSAMDKLIRQKATNDFKNSIVGKGMISKGAVINDVVTDVPESGWMWYFKAYEDLYEIVTSLGRKTIILGHTKQGSLIKDGIKIDASDMNLSGKAKTDLLRDVDACGSMYRKDENTVMISFKTNTKDLTTKSRARHLTNQEFVISEMKDGKLVTYWDKIFKF